MKKDENQELADEIILTLNSPSMGSKLVCIDFDQTFLEIHTQGSWVDTVEELVTHVRPIFKILVPKILTESSIAVAVVTFSPQSSLISKVIHSVFPPDLASRIIIRANDDSWNVSLADSRPFFLSSDVITNNSIVKPTDLSRRNKLPYLISASQQYSNSIYYTDVVLIDDCPNNIREVHSFGIAGLWFNDEVLTERLSSSGISDTKSSLQLLCDNLKKMNIRKTPQKSVFSCGKRKKFHWTTPSPLLKLKTNNTSKSNNNIVLPRKPVKRTKSNKNNACSLFKTPTKQKENSVVVDRNIFIKDSDINNFSSPE